MTTSVTLTICFDASFWVGVLEIAEAGEVRATRHMFGSEPTDAELYQFLLRHGTPLLERAQANPVVPVETRRPVRQNPKRVARLAAREAAATARPKAQAGLTGPPRPPSHEAQRHTTHARHRAPQTTNRRSQPIPPITTTGPVAGY